MMLAEFSITPMGHGEGISPYVARCVTRIRESGLDYELTAMGTIVEGELPQVMRVIEDCFDELMGDCDRITCSAKFDYRKGRSGRIKSKVQSVLSKLD